MGSSQGNFKFFPLHTKNYKSRLVIKFHALSFFLYTSDINCGIFKHRRIEMPYTLVEEKISQISSQFQQELIDFVDFLLYKQNLQTEKNSISQEKQKKLDALNAISGILTAEESNAINDSISAGIKCKEIQL